MMATRERVIDLTHGGQMCFILWLAVGLVSAVSNSASRLHRDLSAWMLRKIAHESPRTLPVMPRTNTHNHIPIHYHAVILTALLALIASHFAAWASPATASQVASPAASPAATPVGNGCDRLDPYFQQMADLIVPNEGLAILKTVNNDVLALTDTQAKTVISSLDELIRRTQAVTPPPAALAYHLAYINLISWYRDLATSRDPASHQRLIDGDKRIVPAIARGVHLGQATCGADVWNAARDAAFPPKP